jgi:hypothetical protein
MQDFSTPAEHSSQHDQVRRCQALQPIVAYSQTGGNPNFIIRSDRIDLRVVHAGQAIQVRR